uniref:Uncharacterized protein n=1 Tax=Alexandrium monilatum TaxID=311494 RepID=A0A7S4SNX7_9DINO
MTQSTRTAHGVSSHRMLSPALKDAVWKGKGEVVQELLTHQGADVHCGDELGRQAIHYAAMRGHWEVTRLLLDLGAEVDAVGPLDSRPLHYAAQYGEKDVAELLLDSEADIEARDAHGNIPMIIARGQSRRDVVDMLVCRAADAAEAHRQSPEAAQEVDS